MTRRDPFHDGRAATPPRLALWMFRRTVPEHERESFEGDLLEAYDERARRGAGTSLWLWRQAIAAALQLRTRARPIEPLLSSGDSRMTTFLADLRHGARLLRRAPAFTIVCVLTLALGVGATTAIFSVVNPILLQPLPFPHPERIVTIWERNQDGERNLGWMTFDDLRRESRTVESMAAMAFWLPTLDAAGGVEAAERATGQRVSASYFGLLGVRPALGRDFRPEEDVYEANRVVILSHGLWQRRFGGDPNVIGQPLSLDGRAHEIVGVMPASFDNVTAPDAAIWRPLGYDASRDWACRSCRHLRVIGRVRPEATPALAQQELERLLSRIVAAHPKDYATTGVFVHGLQESVTRSARPILFAIAGAVLLILLIAVANVASLQLARAARREEEFAIRSALGAARSRVARQLLAEGMLLALIGGAAGVLVAFLALPTLVANLPAELPRIGAVRLDRTALLLAVGLTIALGIATGLAPVLQGGRRALADALRGGSRLTARRHLARGAFVVTEVALALVLLVGAGLLGRSLVGLLSVNPGFEPRGLLTVNVQVTGPRSAEAATVYATHDELVRAVSAVPGVEAVGHANTLPLSGNLDQYGIRAQDRPLENPELAPYADRYVVSSGFMRAMGIPIVRGRGFDGGDTRDSARRVAIVSESIARKMWNGGDAIGKRIQMGANTNPWHEIVGIAGDVRHEGLDVEVTQQVYVPDRQWAWADEAVTLVARARDGVDPASLAASIRSAVRSVDAGMVVEEVATADRLISASSAQRRLALVLFASFAVVALLLAGAGIYGVLAHSVAERTREFGVRTALGASPGTIARTVMAHGARLALPGLAVGLAGALALGKYLRSLLFGVAPTDPATIAGVALLLALVAAAACWIPARRAVRVDPVRALREE